MVGKTLSQYEILAPLGAGGMGTVYRARDTKLERDVAIKVLPDDLAADPDRLARFEREAKLLAALNHANINTIHGLEEADGVRFLVLELIEGETLEQRLHKGAIPVREALDIARQIAEALEAAHDAGIIHRDVKPANVLLTARGGVKVLDFGIAKGVEVDARAALTEQATSLTMDGTLMGTPPYMAPEQVRGAEADKRADIWAFGCVLYEMLTGRGAFARETVADTLAAIIDQEPDWSLMTDGVPAIIPPLVRRCLRKDPRRRLRDIGDAWVEIDEARSASPAGVAGAAHEPASGRGPGVSGGVRWSYAAPGAIAIALLAASATWYLAAPAEAPAGNVMRLEAPLPAEVFAGKLAISPDGRFVVIQGLREGGERQLYLRATDETSWAALEGTGGGSRPFFSPDSQWIGFNDGIGLSKISVTGGEPFRLCRDCADDSSDGSWSARGDAILFDYGDAIWQVAASGGDPDVVAEPGPGESSYERPSLLPDGRTALIELWPQDSPSAIAILDLDTKEARIVAQEGIYPAYSPTGHILYKRDQTLYALPYDAAARQAGEATPLLQGVREFGLSSAGTLAYLAPFVFDDTGRRQLVWLDADGFTPVSDEVRAFHRVALAPDQRRIAVTIEERGGSNVWILDQASGVLSQITFEGGDHPVWSPRGDWLAYAARGDGVWRIYRVSPDMSSAPEVLLSSTNDLAPADISPDGRLLVYIESTPENRRQIKALPLGEESPGPPPDLVPTARDVTTATISPDGNWLAYTSSPRPSLWETHIAAFPGPGQTIQVSNGGGDAPLWSPDGERLFFFTSDGTRMMMVDVVTDPRLSAGEPQLLAPLGARLVYSARAAQRYDITSDGQRMIFAASISPQLPSREFHVVINWFEELERRVPTGR